MLFLLVLLPDSGLYSLTIKKKHHIAARQNLTARASCRAKWVAISRMLAGGVTRCGNIRVTHPPSCPKFGAFNYCTVKVSAVDACADCVCSAGLGCLDPVFP